MELEEIIGKLEEVKQSIFRGLAKNFEIGEHRSSFKGVGYDIHDINTWRRGEPLDSIDWPLTLQTWPQRILKIERPEAKKTPAILIVDTSPSIFVQVDETANKFRLLLHLFGALGFAANYFHDPVGALCVSNSVELYLPPRFGSGRIFFALKQMIDRSREFEEIKAGNRPVTIRSNLNSAFEFLAARLRRQCSIVILSDFMDMINGESDFDVKTVEFLSAKHNWNVVAVLLDDPKEFSWRGGKGTVLVHDIETRAVKEIKAKRSDHIRSAFESNREIFRAKLDRSGVDSVVLSYGDHFNELTQFLSQRKLSRR